MWRKVAGIGVNASPGRIRSYAHGIAKNHPFVDGDKRVAFVLARVFLGLNGVRFDPPEAEAVVMVEGLANSHVSEADFGLWPRKHSK